MARGRRGSYDSGVIVLTRRRDIPLSVDPEYEYRDSRKAQRISDFAMEDADYISSKSRNKDKNLLNSITQRLVHNSYVEPGSVRAAYKKPPLPTAATTTNHYNRRPSIRRVATARPESVLFIRAGSLPPPSRPKPYYEEEEEIYTPPIIPPRKVLTKPRPIYRAASEPPYLGSRAAPLNVEPAYVSSYRPAPLRATRTTKSFTTPSSTLAVKNARRCLERVERELGLENGPTIAEPVIVHHVQAPRIVPRTATRVAHARTAAPRVRSSSLPPSPRGVPRRSRVAEIEARLEQQADVYPEAKPASMSDLRGRATIAKNKLDSHKTMMDRYLPLYLGPEMDVQYEVDYKYGELVNRMPVLDKYRPTQGAISSAALVSPYKPATVKNPRPAGNYGLPPTSSSFRPRVSDTRKRIREVLCATKKDPHYYD